MPHTTGSADVAGSASHGITDARLTAAEVLSDLRSGELLDSSFDRRSADLDSRDRRWTRELIYGTLRRRSWLDGLLHDRVRGGVARLDPDLLDLLRLGAYQLLYMGSVPSYAAIAQSVELAKRRHGLGASKLANAVLRRLDREREGDGAPDLRRPPDRVESLALEHSHPRWLVARWIARWGEAETRALLERNNSEAPLVIRPVHTVREQLEAMLEHAGVHVSDAPLVRDSLLVTDLSSPLTTLGAFRQGLFHVQDPASTLVCLYASFPANSTVADVCAAPGGKSIELSHRAARVYSSDLSPARLRRLQENVRRLEIENVFPFAADARFPACRPVEAVLVDAPCTGTGTFRKHPDARWRLRASDLAVMSSLQRAILRAAADLVAPGGLLVYSTCSLEPEENDAQVEWFLAEQRSWHLEAPPDGTVPPGALDAGRLRVLPQRHGVDGAFAARFRRTEESAPRRPEGLA